MTKDKLWEKELGKMVKEIVEPNREKFKEWLIEKYIENEERNAHTENALLIAEYYGTPTQRKSIEAILRKKKYRGWVEAREASYCFMVTNPHFDKHLRETYVKLRGKINE